MGRFGFVLRRPFELIPVLFGISLVSFVLVQSIPGDPVRILLGSRATAEVIAKVREQYGLDEPIWVQYWLFLENLFRGELGRSIVYKAPVVGLVFERIAPTLFLLAYALALTLVIGFALGSLAASRRGRWPDAAVRLYSTLGLGLPAFWVGIVLVIVFSIGLGLFPTSGYGEGLGGHLYYLFLPALTVALALSPIVIRNLRASLVTELDADYAAAARSRGLPERLIFRRHVLRNALVPTITLLGVNVGWLIGGTVVIEQVFAIPGIGSLMVSSIFARDYLVVQVVTLVLALGVILTNFAVDILTALVDPRIRP